MTRRLYVGVRRTLMRECFRSRTVPTARTHGKRYLYVIGPFRTVADAARVAGRR